MKGFRHEARIFKLEEKQTNRSGMGKGKWKG